MEIYVVYPTYCWAVWIFNPIYFYIPSVRWVMPDIKKTYGRNIWLPKRWRLKRGYLYERLRHHGLFQRQTNRNWIDSFSLLPLFFFFTLSICLRLVRLSLQININTHEPVHRIYRIFKFKVMTEKPVLCKLMVIFVFLSHAHTHTLTAIVGITRHCTALGSHTWRVWF